MTHQLFEFGTFQATDRLVILRQGGRLTTDDVIELWQVFSEAESYVGEPPTLVDFGNWLAGNFADQPTPAEVTW
jgi:hypothetical protein